MIFFQDEPDPLYLAIFEEALAYVREVHLVGYQEGYRPTRAERRDLEESYRDLFPELVPFFTRRELVRVVDRPAAARAPGRAPALRADRLSLGGASFGVPGPL